MMMMNTMYLHTYTFPYFFYLTNVNVYIIAVQSDDDEGGNAKKSAVQMLLFSATMVSNRWYSLLMT